MSTVGQPLRRVEDPRLLVGMAQFLDDLLGEGVLHVAFARSPHAHARISRVDLNACRTAEGVWLALGGADVACLGPIRVDIAAPWHRGTTRPLLATERARFAGEAVAMVVAESRYLAEDALELITAEYDPLPAVSTPESALEEGAARLHDDVPGNILIDRDFETGDVDAAFAAADTVVDVELAHGRQLPSPIEGRAVQAVWDAAAEQLTVWSSTQTPYGTKRMLAECLGLRPEQVRVIVPEVGGGFGLKLHVFPEEVLIAHAAMRLGRPVRWVEDRLENMRAGSQSRNGRVRVRAAARADGTLLAMDAEVMFDQGAYGNFPFGSILEPMGAASMIPGPYRLDAYRYRARAVVTNKCPEGAYRGVGMVISTLVHERVMDALASELDMDPAEIRRRNLIAPAEFPYRSAGGHVYDSGQYALALERALTVADYADLRARQQRLRAQGRYLGIGIACYTEYTGIGSSTFAGRGMHTVSGLESAAISLQADGRVSAAVSLPAIGQGVATTYRQLLAAELGVQVDQIDLVIGDTDRSAEGSGAMASRSASASGGAIRAAAARLVEQLRPLAAELLEVAPADLEWTAGRFHVAGLPDLALTLTEAATEARLRSKDDLTSAMDAYDPSAPTFSSATHVVALEVDPETGLVAVDRYVIVEDCGPQINPRIVEGQVHGATAQGISGALLEELVYDADGQLLTGSFLDYLLPAATDIPELLVLHEETPSPHAPGGFKGAGEGGTVGAPAAVWSAIADALAPLDVKLTHLPLTPERLRAASARL